MKVEERGRNKSRLGLRNWRKEAGTEGVASAPTVYSRVCSKPDF